MVLIRIETLLKVVLIVLLMVNVFGFSVLNSLGDYQEKYPKMEDFVDGLDILFSFAGVFVPFLVIFDKVIDVFNVYYKYRKK